MKIILQIFALSFTARGAYIAFKHGIIEDLKVQMVDLENESGVGIEAIPWHYQTIAFLYLGKKSKWLDIFKSTPDICKKIKSDKTRALRTFLWFLGAFFCTLISILLP